uniref:Reverse transcriptase zinc-binding domain-containing protein n=1 Tax=Tarenaya spinosa TaxID=228870 RepID=Q1KUP0_9ROSI|nr:hypothetical protein [Tarenaya spinosa]
MKALEFRLEFATEFQRTPISNDEIPTDISVGNPLEKLNSNRFSAISNGFAGWNLGARITTILPPTVDAGPDRFEWKTATDSFSTQFSPTKTWDVIRDRAPRVPWFRLVWSRLPTLDRLQRLGITATATCVLCQQAPESHDHLFFDCEFNNAIWEFFASACYSSPPSSLECTDWLHNQLDDEPCTRRELSKLVLHAVAYTIWQERNLDGRQEQQSLPVRRTMTRFFILIGV